jgi:hypothetical protein
MVCFKHKFKKNEENAILIFFNFVLSTLWILFWYFKQMIYIVPVQLSKKTNFSEEDVLETHSIIIHV